MLFSVELLCIVSDDGFGIFLQHLSGGSAYAITDASQTAPGFRTGTISSREHPEIGKLRGEVSAEMRKRKFK